ncbi:MAG: hypothetical protein A2057_16420 [Ignavibacteria bacterium GWA2_35_9]|nr:MAG: hypothetical protein A2057_16420 [Ignavibacteria bacterium GWA2_35_9]OGU49712.1 MAG: hypothetical protein A2080_11990 [Ignavibacteria bacterium GWC2_36_12]OGU98669.1 MAG: hypothetical protein A2330_02185 [Ignavibacteria bacterium RIFOXYB2_FULL_36_7]
MAQKKTNTKVRQIGKNPPEKKHIIDPRYKNAIWTTVILIILLIFFIVNNTRNEPERGPYPPNYKPQSGVQNN